MQLAPYPPPLITTLSDLPFTLTKELESSGVDDQIGDRALRWQSVGHCERAGTLADAAIIRGGQRVQTASRAGPGSHAGRD
jgi:hypothetical protein